MSDLLRILIAPLVWLAAFSAIYALQGLGCATGLHAATLAGMSLLRVALIFAWILAIAILAGILVWLQRTSPTLEWTRSVSRITGWAALVAAVWALFPLVILSVCR